VAVEPGDQQLREGARYINFLALIIKRASPERCHILNDELLPRHPPRQMKKHGIASGVARAPKEGGCWAQVYVYAGDDWPPLAVRGNPARKGFLTCVKHQAREAAAQKLQAENSTSTSR